MMEIKFAEELEAKSQLASDAVTTVSTINILIMLLFGISLKAIWSVLNTLQLLIFFTDIKANLAPHPTFIMEVLKIVALC